MGTTHHNASVSASTLLCTMGRGRAACTPVLHPQTCQRRLLEMRLPTDLDLSAVRRYISKLSPEELLRFLNRLGVERVPGLVMLVGTTRTLQVPDSLHCLSE